MAGFFLVRTFMQGLWNCIMTYLWSFAHLYCYCIRSGDFFNFIYRLWQMARTCVCHCCWEIGECLALVCTVLKQITLFFGCLELSDFRLTGFKNKSHFSLGVRNCQSCWQILGTNRVTLWVCNSKCTRTEDCSYKSESNQMCSCQCWGVSLPT